MKKRILSIVLCVVLALSLLPAAALADNGEKQVTINVPTPVAGKTPVECAPTFQVSPDGSEEYPYIVVWGVATPEAYAADPSDFEMLNPFTPFEEGNYYVVMIGLASDNGRTTFTNLTLNTAGTVAHSSNTGTIVRANVLFDLTGANAATDGEVAPNVFPVVTPAEETEEPATDVDEGTDEEEVTEDEAVEDVEDVEDAEDEELDEELDETVEEADEAEEAPRTGDASTNLWIALTLAAVAVLAAAGVMIRKENA